MRVTRGWRAHRREAAAGRIGGTRGCRAHRRRRGGRRRHKQARYDERPGDA